MRAPHTSSSPDKNIDILTLLSTLFAPSFNRILFCNFRHNYVQFCTGFCTQLYFLFHNVLQGFLSSYFQFSSQECKTLMLISTFSALKICPLIIVDCFLAFRPFCNSNFMYKLVLQSVISGYAHISAPLCSFKFNEVNL